MGSVKIIIHWSGVLVLLKTCTSGFTRNADL